MAFPTTGILDDFDRANEGPPPSANWTSSILVGFAGMSVVSNVCVIANDGSGWWNASQFGPATEAYCTFTNLNNTFYLFARVQSPGEAGVDGYTVLLTPPLTAAQFFRIDNGSFTQLGADESVTFGDGQGMGFEAVGADLTLYKNAGSWALVGSRSDSTYSAAGFIGVAGDDPGDSFDDFGGGTVVDTGLAWIAA